MMARADVPRRPDVVLEFFVDHMRRVHDSAQILEWYHDCVACGECEAEYAASMAYWMDLPDEPAPDRLEMLLVASDKTFKPLGMTT